MLKNYIKVAFRNIARNKLYAVINIAGLAMGLAIYIFGGLLANYEYSYDAFFKKSDRIYTLGSMFPPETEGNGTTEINTVYSAVTPLLKTEQSEIDAIARTIARNFLLTVGEDSYYQTLRFADPEFLQIFDFDYIYGNSSALINSSGAVITQSMAKKYFKDQNPMGKTITIEHNHDLTVSAVIKDLPANTHFNSQIVVDLPFEIIAPISAMEKITDDNPDENWGNLSSGNMTYVMLPAHLDGQWLKNQVNGLYERHYTPQKKKDIISIPVRHLVEANMAVWISVGIPVISVVEMLGLLVLIIACVNYTNLATAQSMGRAREVGLRKTLGAGPVQLLTQFIVESMTITVFAMIVALSLLELIIPTFNAFTGKILTIDYLTTLPWLLLTTLFVGVLSGAYPAYLITKTSPIEALRDTARKSRAATWVRGLMISVQFTISVFMLALVLVVYSQNKMVEESSNIFPKDQIYTLDGLSVEQTNGRHEILRNEMLKISGVENFTLSSQVPYESYQNMFTATSIINDFSAGFNINQLVIDQEFLKTYNIPLVAGRAVALDVALDTHVRANHKVNVLVNELSVQKLGFLSPEQAIGKPFYEDEGARGITTYTIVGVVKNQNILGLHNKIKPFIMFIRPASYRTASIKLSSTATAQTITDIKETWKRVIPDYPMKGRFLNERFQDVYEIFEMASKSLAAFAGFALLLALIGLFGLAAFMAEQRTKEIGIRKILGASPLQIIKLLIWQFSKPVVWATPIALAFAYLASTTYLDFFEDRIAIPYGILVMAGAVGLILSWVTVATHAYKIARTNPINALHYE